MERLLMGKCLWSKVKTEQARRLHQLGWWLCQSEIDILLCESSTTLYVWNIFPMQLFLMMKFEMSMGIYVASLCLKKIMLRVDGMCQSEIVSRSLFRETIHNRKYVELQIAWLWLKFKIY